MKCEVTSGPGVVGLTIKQTDRYHESVLVAKFYRWPRDQFGIYDIALHRYAGDDGELCTYSPTGRCHVDQLWHGADYSDFSICLKYFSRWDVVVAFLAKFGFNLSYTNKIKLERAFREFVQLEVQPEAKDGA